MFDHISRTAHIHNVSADILDAALPHSYATGEGLVCVHTDTVIHELNPQTKAEQKLYQIAKAALPLNVSDIILEE